MASTFKRSLELTGLTRATASVFLGVSENTIKDWMQGKTRPPLGVWVMLAVRMRAILDASEFGADHLNLHGVDGRAFANIAVSLGTDDLDGPSGEVAGALALLMSIDDAGLAPE